MDDDLFEVVLGQRARHTPAPTDAAFIDLTEDPDSPPARPTQRAPQGARHARSTSANTHNNHTHNARPGRNHPANNPPAQRNRASTPVIDLTGDDSPPQPRNPPQHPPGVGLEPEQLDDIIILRSLHHHAPRNRRPPPANRPRLASTFSDNLRYLGNLGNLGVHLLPGLGPFGGAGNVPALNYQHPAFEPPPPPPPPPAAAQPDKMEVAAPREGFARDTGEDMVVVCPACGDELEYDPGKSAGKKKKSQKEHHFWAVKACGHVYCQQCFENRKTTTKNTSKFRALDGSAVVPPRAGMLCAVEDCRTEVTGKAAWVGIYL